MECHHRKQQQQQFETTVDVDVTSENGWLSCNLHFDYHFLFALEKRRHTSRQNDGASLPNSITTRTYTSLLKNLRRL